MKVFKTERENNLDSRYELNKEPIHSRYLTQSKKKYYLTSVDQNMDQLKEDQVKTLTELLIELKSEYDQLIRDSTTNKRMTEELGKQIQMLEKMEKKTKSKVTDMDENYSNMEYLIELKKVKKEEELYNKLTLSNLIEKMKDELMIMKKEIAAQEIGSRSLNKKLEKEIITENSIKERVNQVYSKIFGQRMKNALDRNDSNLVLNYYQNIIEQKWKFIYSADERKAKQIKIAIDAKNDSQDKQEVEKRKLLFMYVLYDKYLRRKMEKELKENEKIEETFLTIRNVTGNSNLKTMVDKILNKDKNYNLCVSKVAERQNKIDILRKDIYKLEEDLQKLKNDVTDEEVKPTMNSTNADASSNLSKTFNKNPIEEDELLLVEEEEALMKELKYLQEKHKDVKLIYEKVFDNIKFICKTDMKKDETLNITQAHNVNESKTVDNSIMKDQSTFNQNMNSQSLIISQNQEEELYKSYVEVLETSKKQIESLFLIHKKEEFLNMMRDKGIEPAMNSKSNQTKESIKKALGKSSFSNQQRPSVKDLIVKSKINNNEEYEYSDEDIKKEDEEIKLENNEILKQYRAMEKAKLMEFLRVEKKQI